MADWFLDLGVVQVAGEEDRSGERAPRVVGAFARLSRIACISLPFSRKTHFSASSALSSSGYGLASGPVVAEETEDLRRAVKQATLRGPKFASTLAFFGCLGLPWRIDAGAQALLAPWFVLHRAYGAGRLDADRLGWLWDASSAGKTGPFAAAAVGAARCGVVGDWRGLEGGSGRVLLEPLGCPKAVLRDFLLGEHELAQCRKLDSTRSSYRGVAGGVDHWAVQWALRAAHLNYAQAGAMRAVMVGNHSTQTRAAHWQGGCTKCRFCMAARECPFHRFWLCPRWEGARRPKLCGLTVAAVVAESPRLLLEHGLLPVSPTLAEAREAATRPAERPGPDPVGAVRFFTDGSALLPRDPWLRRAAWAVCWRENGLWCHHSAGTSGRQTVARSELAAALWAVLRAGCPVTVVTDSRYVHDGFQAVQRGEGSALT